MSVYLILVFLAEAEAGRPILQNPHAALLSNLRVIEISGPTHHAIVAISGATIELHITSFPMIVVIPQTSALEISVECGDFTGEFNETDFGVYFSSNIGNLTVNVLYDTFFEYYAIAPNCSSFYLSTFPTQRFVGSGTNWIFSAGNVSVAHGQDVCFYYLSDSRIDVTVDYDIHVGDVLHANRTVYSGLGSFALSEHEVFGLRWTSSGGTLSGGFAVACDSPGSSLPALRDGAAETRILGGSVWATETPRPTRSASGDLTIAIGERGHDRFVITPGSTVVLNATVHPMVVVVPRREGLTLEVRSHGTLFDFLNEESFGVYFSAPSGSIIVRGAGELE
jgi:hypothetical protein